MKAGVSIARRGLRFG
jgi:hypothetical protein